MRKIAIGTALAATLLACWLAPDDDSVVMAPARATAIASSAQPIVPVVQAPALPEIRARTGDDDLGNVFARQSWQADTSAAAVEVPAQRATVKPAAATVASSAAVLPIRLLGRFVDDGREAYFLQVDERNVVAYVGDRIDERYTFDSAADGALTFTYLPTRKQQVLAVEESN